MTAALKRGAKTMKKTTENISTKKARRAKAPADLSAAGPPRYMDYFTVSTSRHKLQLSLAILDGQGAPHLAHTVIVMPPWILKELSRILSGQVVKYEREYGPIS